MHAVSHSLAHRGPGASRARPRWQPYSSTISQTTPQSLRPSPQNYLNTPSSIVTPSPPSTSSLNPIQLCNPDRPRKVLPNPPQSVQYREALKNRYVTRLVDQAVNSLCDIWLPDDIPTVFRTSSRTAFSASLPCDTAAPQRDALTPSLHRNIQLPSPPISPSSQPSPPSPPAPVQFTPSLISLDEQSPSESSRGSQILTIKGFVHEVLRRSRTSTGVLQTALCYLEAIRSKVPEVLHKENSKTEGADLSPEVDAESRIIIGEDIAEGAMSISDADSDSSLNSTVYMAHSGLPQDVIPTVRIDDCDEAPLTAPQTQVFPSMSPSSAPAVTSSNPKTPSPKLPPMPPLPSPLLCPRRTFLACLILASKFMQDRSYSNRAWAKLAGLPPREIGRCERALGEALEWRLWVGKSPSPNVNSTGPATRPVTRCRSENNLVFGVSSSATLPVPQVGPPAAVSCNNGSKLSGLRRSATVPSLGTNSGPVQDPFVQHSLFLASRPFEEPESILPESAQVDSPASMYVSPPTMFVTPPPPDPTSDPSMLHPQSFASISQFFDEFSPSLSTPGLSYSPMSTASTSSSDDGERTIQMSTFMDLPSSLSGPGFSAMASSGYPAYAASAKFDLAAQTVMNTKPAAGMNMTTERGHQLNQNWTGGVVDGSAMSSRLPGLPHLYSHPPGWIRVTRIHRWHR
ncbi:hypothetical protein QCA50_009552 [Cerrena zonata]|uniref:G1/S-specific cyclin pas1 n=1 Tax=Cerrena zonata TaxID=2478898 RepID=A0AAW0G3W3_9APHY